MIIPRKYEWLGALYQNDKLAKEAIDRAFIAEHISEERKGELLNYNHYNTPAFLNLGCGIPGACFARFMKEFDDLDKANPYDNGLSFSDVSDIEFENNSEGSAIQMRFVSKAQDRLYRIVGLAALKSTKGKIVLSKGWQMTPPFMIG